MATLETKECAKAVRLLLIGESGTGKTGALASLVETGYSLYILDFDNGLDYLANDLRRRKMPTSFFLVSTSRPTRTR